ncbi:hypothetical protein [Planomicrobium sp. CPCC 101110]|uniref:hypothetical protein n=1 Tax=Planomicrobium sp. CPCC 101110 TaxID=2599619 RepID=UPI00164745DB|nr:hypothetical protein [Planomicrobium sp. CPCC 101110]
MPLIDPFLEQLVIVPFGVVGFGLFAAIRSKKVIVGPIVTLLLNVLYEVWYSFSFDPNIELFLSLRNITFPLLTLALSLLVLVAKVPKVPKDSD